MPAEGTKGFPWRLGCGGPGQPLDPMVDCLLAGSGCARVASCPWGARRMVQPDRYKIFRHDCPLGGSSRLFPVFWLAPENPLGSAASLACEPIQPQHKTVSLRLPFPVPQEAGSHCSPMIFFSIKRLLQRLLNRLFLPKSCCRPCACISFFTPTAPKPKAGNPVLVTLRTEHC